MITPINDRDDLFLRLEAIREQLRARGVQKLGLFGSFVRGEASDDSDVDFLVQFDPRSKTFDNFMQLSLLLEETLQRPVELVTTESISPFLGPQILSEVENVPLGN